MYYVVAARIGQRTQLTSVNDGEFDVAVEFEGLEGSLTVNSRGDDDPPGQAIEVHGRVALAVSRPLTVFVRAVDGPAGLRYGAEPDNWNA